MHIPLSTSLLCVAVVLCLSEDARSERQSFVVNGRASSILNAWGQNHSSDFPVKGTLDIEYDDSMTLLSFKNVDLLSGIWSDPPGNMLADFSSSTKYPLVLDELQGQIRDDGSVFFKERPAGYFPPWEQPEPVPGELFVTVYYPTFVGTGIDGLFSPDRQSMQFIKLSDYSVADGARSTVFLELQAVPEPSSICLSVSATVAAWALLRRRRHLDDAATRSARRRPGSRRKASFDF